MYEKTCGVESDVRLVRSWPVYMCNRVRSPFGAMRRVQWYPRMLERDDKLPWEGEIACGEMVQVDVKM